MSGYAANTIQTGVLGLILNGIATSGLCSSSTASTSLWVALHTADPGSTGAQSTNETTYTSYLRISVSRTTGGWQVTGNNPASASPAAAINFATCTASSTTVVTNFSVGPSSSGTGTLWLSGPVSPNITVTTNVSPSLTTGTAITLD